MNVLKHKLTLEMTALDSQVTVRIKKDDTNNRLIISLSENGKPYKITQNLRAVFVGKKPDGQIVFNDCDIVGNTIEYTITAQTSVVVGIVSCELRLYGANNKLLTSPRFTVIVDEIIYNADDVQKESENEINVLDSLISEVTDIKDNLELDLKWKAVALNGEDSYLLKQGKLYRIYGNYASAAVEPFLQVYLTVDPGFAGDNIQTYIVDEAYSLGFDENNGYVTVQIIGCDIIDDTGVNVRYLLNGEERTSVCTVYNPGGEVLEANVYASLICADINNTTVYELREGILLTDTATGKPYEIYIANGKIIYQPSPSSKMAVIILDSNDKKELQDQIDKLKDEGLDIDLQDYLTRTSFYQYITGIITMPNPIVDRLDVITHARFDGTVSVKEPTGNSHPTTKGYVDGYLNGAVTMPNPIVDRLDVITHATFDGTVIVKPPVLDNHPATKKYVDDLFAGIEIAEEGAY